MTNYPTYKLGEVADYINGRAFKPSEWKENGLPIVRIQNLNDESAVYHYSDAEHEEKYLLHDGDLLFAWAASLGTYIWNGGEAWLNQHIFKVLPKQNVSKMYLYYALTSIIKELYSKSHGSGMVHVTKGKFEETEIPLPPLPTQQAIVARIESLFAELDKAAEHLRTAQQQLKTYRQAVLNHWLKNDDGKWEMVKLGEVAEIVTGNTPPKKDMSLYGNDYPFYKPSDLNAGINTIHSEDNVSIKGFNASRKLPNGSILVTCIGATIGKTGLIHREGICNQQINAILPNDSFVPECLFYIVTSDSFQRQIKSNASATTLPILNKSKFSDLEFSLPPLSDQHRIVQEIESRLSQATASETYIEKALQQAEALRQSILKKAFEGNLV